MVTRNPFGVFRQVNRRGCPGSCATVDPNENGYGECPFCRGIYVVSPKTGMLRAHKRQP